jgi:Group II intron, maturase-specific domain
MTGWCSWPVPAPTPKRCVTKQRRSSPRWACACRWRRRESRTSTRGYFLGRHIQRHSKRGTEQQHVYTYPSKRALESIKDKVRTATQRTTTNQSLADLCDRLNPALRGWTTHFRHDVSKATFSHLRAFLWKRTVRWLRKKHPDTSWKQLRRRYLSEWWPTEGERTLFNPSAVPVTRYRYRGDRIPSPLGHTDGEERRKPRLNELAESRMRGNSHVRFGGAGRGNSRPRGRRRAPARL